MTHHTDAERAAYQSELIDNHHYVQSDFYFKDGFYGGDDYIQLGWDLWKAASRAPESQSRVPMLFNPFNGKPRHPLDVQSDPYGLLITAPNAEVRAASITQQKKP